MNYYVVIGDQQSGPMSAKKLAHLIKAGRVDSKTLAKHDGIEFQRLALLIGNIDVWANTQIDKPVEKPVPNLVPVSQPEKLVKRESSIDWNAVRSIRYFVLFFLVLAFLFACYAEPIFENSNQVLFIIAFLCWIVRPYHHGK